MAQMTLKAPRLRRAWASFRCSEARAGSAFQRWRRCSAVSAGVRAFDALSALAIRLLCPITEGRPCKTVRSRSRPRAMVSAVRVTWRSCATSRSLLRHFAYWLDTSQAVTIQASAVSSVTIRMRPGCTFSTAWRSGPGKRDDCIMILVWSIAQSINFVLITQSFLDQAKKTGSLGFPFLAIQPVGRIRRLGLRLAP